MKIVIINGPNMNMLGIREPEVYSTMTYAQLCDFIALNAPKHELTFFQSNGEKEIIDTIHHAHDQFDGIIINPAAYTHYSYAILDALKAVRTPAVEVHLSNIHDREDFRQISVTQAGCIAQISGLGKEGYLQAIQLLETLDQ